MIQRACGSPRLAWLVETHVRPMYDAVRAMIEAAQRGASHRSADPSTCYCCQAASSAYALSAEFELLTGKAANQEALVAEHVAALERMFFPTTS
jgi:hypothetical protein